MNDMYVLRRALIVAVVSSGACFLDVDAVRAGDNTPSAKPADGQSADPLEPMNRFMSGFNRALRDVLIDPMVDGYKAVTPEPVQHSVSNVLSNLSEPVTAVSSMVQGDAENAGTATTRFLINSTVGFGGTSDRATNMGYVQRREDLGQAFGANGVSAGPHIVLPILGPSNLRDATGQLLTGLTNPFPLAVQAADGGVRYSDNKDDIQAISRGSIDPYVAEREAYEQHRAYVVTNGDLPVGPNFPTLAEQPPTK